jgi:hypothetical protein
MCLRGCPSEHFRFPVFLLHLRLNPVICAAHRLCAFHAHAVPRRYSANYSALATPLPPNVHLLTAHSWGPGRLLLRLSHSYEVGEDAVLSANATISLKALFAHLSIDAAVEMTATGNQALSDVTPTTYLLQGGDKVTLPVVPGEPVGPGMSVTLTPMSVRTFLCNVSAI